MKIEEELWRRGFEYIAGVDEVGRGAIAGPVLAAAVILPKNFSPSWIKDIKDSKLIKESKREYLSYCIKKNAVSFAIGIVDPRYIDEFGIVDATRRAMLTAIKNLSRRPDFVLIDFMILPGLDIPSRSIVKGERESITIASASIIAKTERDRILREMEDVYPGYNFARNKGYGTREHMNAIKKLGPCEIHRRSFRPVKHYAGEEG